jgi:DeoR family transcriptional regulator, fructose operon transcriptional repressor
MSAARRTIVAADGGRLGRTAFAHVGPARLLHTLVTDTVAPADEIAALEAAGVAVTTV